MTTDLAEATQDDIPGEIFSAHSLYPGINESNEELLIQKATSENDTLYYHGEVMEKDHEQFGTAMHTEVKDQFANGNLRVTPRDKVPSGKKIHKKVWKLRRKRHVSTGEIKKYKARLNLDGPKMVQG